jgi:hypothetical protein
MGREETMTNADEKWLSEKAARELEGQVATRPSTHFQPTDYRAIFRGIGGSGLLAEPQPNRRSLVSFLTPT